MNIFNSILPFALVLGAMIAAGFAFSKAISILPRWVRNAYLLLSVGMGSWGVVAFLNVHKQRFLSEHTYSLILQARAWLAGFSLGILIILMLAGVFPRIFSRSR